MGLEKQKEALINDPQLMALELWMQEDDFFTLPDFVEHQGSYMKLGLASGLPSIIEMGVIAASTYGLGTAATFIRGGAKAVQAGTKLIQGLTKGSAMAYGEEQGLSP